MEQSANSANGILAKAAASYVESDCELSITVGLNDLYDFFNMDSLGQREGHDVPTGGNKHHHPQTTEAAAQARGA